MKMLRCPACKRLKAVRREQKHCSRACAFAQRGAAFRQALAQKAGRAAGRARRARLLARWKAEYPDLNPALVWEIWRRADLAGFQRGKYYGYRRGWAEACGEKWDTEKKIA